MKSVIYTALLRRKLFLGSSRKEPREGEKDTQAQKGEEREKENGAETKEQAEIKSKQTINFFPLAFFSSVIK